MPWYAVQDSDWDWDQSDGPAILVYADSPQQAIRDAVEQFGDGDGITAKVAELKPLGIMSGGKDMSSTWVWDEYVHFDNKTDLLQTDEFEALSRAWKTMTQDDKFTFGSRISMWIHEHGHRCSPAECYRAVQNLLENHVVDLSNT